MGSSQGTLASSPVARSPDVPHPSDVPRPRDRYFEIEGGLDMCRPTTIGNLKGTRFEPIRDVYNFIIAEMLKPRLICDVGNYTLYEYNRRYYVKGHHPAWDRNVKNGSEFDGGRIVSGILYDCEGVWATEIDITTLPPRELSRVGWVFSTVRGRCILSTNNKGIPIGGAELQ